MRRMSIVLVGLLAACSGDDDVVATGEMSVTLRNWMGEPIADADVWTHDREGSLTAQASTDIAGRATLLVAEGGSVTAHDEWTLAAGEWTTVLGVAPGDDVALDFQTLLQRQPGVPVGETAAFFTVPEAPINTAFVIASARCASGFASAEFEAPTRVGVRFTCSGPTTVVLEAKRDDGVVNGYIVLRDVNFTDGAEIPVADSWTRSETLFDVDISGGTQDDGPCEVWRVAEWQRHGLGRFSGHHDGAMMDSPGMTAGARVDLDGEPAYLMRIGYSTNPDFFVETNQQPVDRFAIDLDSLPSPAPVAVSADSRELTWTDVPDADMVEMRLGIAQTYDNGQTELVARWTVLSPPGRSSHHFLEDVGFPFLGTSPFATDLHSYSVRTWRSSWFPDYVTLRTGAPLPAAPAHFTTESVRDGQSIDPVNP